ncbi:MAG: hypothetical protein HN976_43555 [Lentisphaerae bacterium]|nr:hypothetical protein [Lentisphaerota bacterium]MBT7062041.1 hypothetical protein [Lentisphaerota bacterium]
MPPSRAIANAGERGATTGLAEVEKAAPAREDAEAVEAAAVEFSTEERSFAPQPGQ